MLHVHAVDKKKQVDDICDRCNSDMPGIKQAANLLEKEFANQGLLTHKVVDPWRAGLQPGEPEQLRWLPGFSHLEGGGPKGDGLEPEEPGQLRWLPVSRSRAH